MVTREVLSPRLPGVKAGADAMQQDQRGCLSGTIVPHMQSLFGDIHHVGRRAKVLGLE